VLLRWASCDVRSLAWWRRQQEPDAAQTIDTRQQDRRTTAGAEDLVLASGRLPPSCDPRRTHVHAGLEQQWWRAGSRRVDPPTLPDKIRLRSCGNGVQANLALLAWSRHPAKVGRSPPYVTAEAYHSFRDERCCGRDRQQGHCPSAMWRVSTAGAGNSLSGCSRSMPITCLRKDIPKGSGCASKAAEVLFNIRYTATAQYVDLRA